MSRRNHRVTRFAAFMVMTLVAVTATAATPSTAAQADDADDVSDAENLLTPMDVFALEWASDPRVSPDGDTIAYTRVGFDIMKDRRTTRIWLIDADGRRHRPMTDRSGYAARFSPDGSRVAFLSATAEGTELFMHWLADNRTARLTQLPESPAGLTWSPDSRSLAFTMFKPVQSKPMVSPVKAPEGAKWAPPFKVYEQVQYRADGRGYLRPGFTHVYVIAADGGAPRQVTSGNYNHSGGVSWARDGQSLFVSGNRHENWALEPQNTDLYQVSVSNGEIEQITDRDGPDTQPRVSPNGRYLAYLGYDDKRRGYENSQLYLRDLNDGSIRSLTADLDRSVGGIVWRDDSRGLYFQHDNDGMGQVATTDLSGRISNLVDDLGGTAMTRPYSGGSFAAADGTVVYTRSVAAQPADLALATRSGARGLTSLNSNLLDHRELGEISEIRFPSSLDDREIQAWVAKPPNFDPAKKYPLILEIHGGPHTAYGPHFSSEVQLFAAAGYLVLYVNPRGSTSYGEEFANLIHHAYPGGDFDDLMSAVDYTIEAGWTDPDELYVTGGSGGGILTAWIVSHTDRFVAAVAAKPVINWYTFVLTADMYPFFVRNWFARPPWEDAVAYLERSPLYYVDRVTTPTMLMTGENDHRTPISESEQFYQALKLRGVDTALVRAPEASHGIASRPSQLIAKVQHILAWFERYRGAETDKSINGDEDEDG
jgi:acylaminoacyl-peptidase